MLENRGLERSKLTNAFDALVPRTSLTSGPHSVDNDHNRLEILAQNIWSVCKYVLGAESLQEHGRCLFGLVCTHADRPAKRQTNTFGLQALGWPMCFVLDLCYWV
jgi:hypothetical protein